MPLGRPIVEFANGPDRCAVFRNAAGRYDFYSLPGDRVDEHPTLALALSQFDMFVANSVAVLAFCMR